MDHRKTKTERRSLCWLLVMNRLTDQLGINVFRYEKDKRKRTNKIITAAVILVCLVMAVGYCGAMAYGYVSVGLSQLIPGMIGICFCHNQSNTLKLTVKNTKKS